jgi:hypothetical protein
VTRIHEAAIADLSAPDLIDPVIGFRQWRLTEHGLRSLMSEQPWPAATLTADCLERQHVAVPSPATDCSCGIYAWYDPSPRTAAAADYITGAVVLWGAIEMHATGMRAQHCRIVALALPFSRWGKRDRLLRTAARLGVPAVPHRSLRSVARGHGAAIPRELRPPKEWATAGQGPMGVVPRLVNSAVVASTRRRAK